MQSAPVTTEPMAKWNGIEETVEVLPMEVADYIRRGYVILMGYARRMDVMEQILENGYCLHKTRCEYQSVVLMGRTKLDTLQEQVLNLTARVNSLVESEKKLDEMQKERITLDNRLSGAMSDNENLRKLYTDKTSEISTIQTTKYKLEADIGKIRNAIGELKMKDILGA